MRMTPERQLLELIEKGYPQGVLFKNNDASCAKPPCGFARARVRLGAFALAACLAAFLAVSLSRQLRTIVQRSPADSSRVSVQGIEPEPVLGTAPDTKPQWRPELAEALTRQRSAQLVAAANPHRSRYQDLRLAGISWSDDPDALIEDAARGVTFFLKKGQVIDGGILVKDIYKDKVILESYGKRIELQ